MPYVTLVRDGQTPSAIPAPNKVHHNFLVANYGADGERISGSASASHAGMPTRSSAGGCLDNDDGSSFYDIVSNFCVYGEALLSTEGK